MKKPSKKSKKVTIKWKGVSKARGYEVYYGTTKSASKKLKTTSKLSYSKSGLKSGKKYYFKVRSYIVVNGVKTYSGFTKVKSIKI